MKILILGSGGREHAFAWKISQSPLCDKLYVAPGNAGTAMLAENVSLNILDFEAVSGFCLEKGIDMLVPGGEDPLVKGITDFFSSDARLRNILVVGPSKEGAQLEGSKDFAKRFMQKHGIPTAAYQTFTADNLEEGFRFIDKLPSPYVLKADGLAAGKGVVILPDKESAKAELKSMLADAKFGEASSRVVIEEFLQGIELSVFVLTDGKHYLVLPSAKDYKRIGEGDSGLNTGGMGAVSPVPFADAAFLRKVEDRIIKPTVEGLKKDNTPYRGFIFIGLMNVKGDPYVIEYNVRMGDPETEAVFPRLSTDLAALLAATAQGRLDEMKLEVDPRTAVVVVVASGGYPGSFEKGLPVSLPDQQRSLIFHAGTLNKEDDLLTNGGRVFAVCSFGKDIAEAAAASTLTAGEISFKNSYYRKDIGRDLMGTAH